MGIAIFGGSFDPIHNGHIRYAEEALKLGFITDVYFVPAFVSPHKVHLSATETTASAEDRLNMVTEAVSGYDNFKVLDIEIRRGGKSFTIDTLEGLVNFLSEEDLYLLMGEDAFADLPKWHRYKDILNICDLIVMARGRESTSISDKNAYGKALADKVVGGEAVANSSEFWYDENSEVIITSYGSRAILLTNNLLEVSSTEIREMAVGGVDFSHLVPKEVFDYIIVNKLYTK